MNENLPLYQCHKKVRAAKIGSIAQHGQTGAASLDLVMPEGVGERFLSVDVTAEWMARFKPETGGYYVVYQDGYASFSPAKAFEEGYELLEG
jgi:hypothetical protein